MPQHVRNPAVSCGVSRRTMELRPTPNPMFPRSSGSGPGPETPADRLLHAVAIHGTAFAWTILVGAYAIDLVDRNKIVGELFVLMVCAAAGTSGLLTGRLSFRLSLPVVCIIGFGTASYLWSVESQATQFMVRTAYVPTMILCIGMARLSASDGRRILTGFAHIVVASTYLHLLLVSRARSSSAVDTLTGQDNPLSSPGGIGGGFGHKNVLGIALIVAFAIFYNVRVTRRTLWLTLTILLVLLTQSATTGAGVLVVFAASYMFGLTRVEHASAGTAIRKVLAITTLLLSPVFLLTVFPYFLRVYNKDLTFTSRTDIWAASVPVFFDRPIHGYGLFGLWVNANEPVTYGMNRMIGFTAAHAHSGFLQLGLDLGLIGVGLYIALFAGMVHVSRQVDDLAIFVRGMLVGAIIISISESIFVSQWNALWLMLAWVVSIASRPQPELSRPEPDVPNARASAARESVARGPAEPGLLDNGGVTEAVA